MASKGRSGKTQCPGREDGKDAVTQDGMLPPRVNGSVQKIGHMLSDAYMSVKHIIHELKHNINEKFARMLNAVFHIIWRL